MAGTKWRNQTSVTEFILLGFGDLPELQILLFLLFLVIYIVTMAGNILIVALVVTDQHLHTPMYFFLGNLSCLETCYTSTILPKILASFLTGDRTISVRGCIAQFYFFCSLAATECYLLAAMSYDRYLAICKPLHYAPVMNSRFILQLAAGSWILGSLACSTVIYLMSQLIFCGPNEIDHFFCDFTPIIKLSCSKNHLVVLLDSILACVFTLPPFLLTVISYIFIITTILRIPSITGRQKAFSTCSSHLIIVTIFYLTLMIVYMLPKTNQLRAFHTVLSVGYTVVTPLANPLIYSLRNKEVKEALRKVVSKLVPFTRHRTY
ncbi:olfactory receptor 6B1-like [Terrapene carolina triunguis]|uniref:olfactory receptor 6B1-like n=1 Tax=Terrapene triunguis TaxID=2587831 RepID=UPI000CEFB659|nr:olfactory receptor 6B1-like [Terrapene carolina triunguis]